MRTDEIMTAAEAHEASALPRAGLAMADPAAAHPALPSIEAVCGPGEQKTPARWAYERLILYIRNFEDQLDAAHEVAVGFAGSDAGVLRIDGLGYFDPDLVTFLGVDEDGAKTQLIQHVSQLNVILRAVPKVTTQAPARRIGFRLFDALGGTAALGEG